SNRRRQGRGAAGSARKRVPDFAEVLAIHPVEMFETLAHAPSAAAGRLSLKRVIIRHPGEQRGRALPYGGDIVEKRRDLRGHGMILPTPMPRFLLVAALAFASAGAA